jgi:hypothetical protein
MLEDIGFEGFFDGVWELHACVREKFYTVVMERIVGSGNDNAGLKVILADETSDARRGYDACKSYRPACLRDSSGKKSGDVRARFARVHANEDVSGGMFAEQIGGEGTAGGEESGVVERRSAGNSANTVCSEKFFGHERLAADSCRADHTKV